MCSVWACRSMPPGVEPKGHFREKTAIFRVRGGRLVSTKGMRFHADSMDRRSPDHVFLVLLEKLVAQVAAEGVRRRSRAGIVKRTMKKRVVESLDWVDG